jgi:pimeloyl-ACP methyl ester carboxylesterase
MPQPGAAAKTRPGAAATSEPAAAAKTQPGTPAKTELGPVLLLHGQPGSARDWRLVIAALGPGAEAIAFDRPGWDGNSATTDLAGNAEAARAALDLHGAESATVVGHSLGAAIAAMLAILHPERVSRLVLASPVVNAASLRPGDRLLAAPLIGPVASVAALAGGGIALAGAGFALATPALRRKLAAAERLDDAYLRATARSLLRAAVWRAFLTEQRVLVRELPMLESRLTQIAAPTTIVSGTEDRIVPPEAARRLASQIQAAELVMIERAGHLLPQLHPDRIVAALQSGERASTQGTPAIRAGPTERRPRGRGRLRL